MIYGNINERNGIKGLHPLIQKAVRFAADTDFSTLDYGVHSPDTDFQVQVIDMTTSAYENTRGEMHRNMIDLHLSLEGLETVYCRPDSAGLTVTEDLSPERDICFFDTVNGEIEIPLAKGDFALFFPGEVHRPGCSQKGEKKIKKIVIKIDSTLLV